MDGSATTRTASTAAEPVFLAVEGIDGSGKTTLTAALSEALPRRGLKVAVHKEPSHGPVGVLFRRLSAAGGTAPMAMALLSAADRHEQQAVLAQHGQECDVIVSDRYYLSGLAYHAADGIDPAFYQGLNGSVRKPTAYLYLAISPALAAARGSGAPGDYWEREEIAARLPDAYERCLALVVGSEAARMVRIDASRSSQRVLACALAAVLTLVGGGLEPGDG